MSLLLFFYKKTEGIKIENLFLSFFRSEASAWTQALLVKKEYLEKAGPFSENNSFDDAEYILSLSLLCKGVILYEPLTYRRLHDNNHSSMKWVQFHEQGLAIIRKYRDNKLLPAALARESLFRSYINLGEKYLVHKGRRKAIFYFYEAWINKPLSIVPLKKMAKVALNIFKK